MNVVLARPAAAPSWAAPRWTWAAVLWSALLTALLFIGLPLLEKIAAPATDELHLREIRTMALPPPPPPPPAARPPEPVPREAPKPHLETATPRLTPLALSLSLGSGLGGLQGDFFADFALADRAGAPDTGAYVFEIAELDEPPRALFQFPPAYPAQARMRRMDGYVTLTFVVGPDGLPGSIAVVDSSPPELFDAAAIQAVGRWRFQPGRRGGQAVATRVQQRLTFEWETR